MIRIRCGTARFGGQVFPLWAAMTDDWIQRRTETCQRGNVCVLHMVLPMDLGYFALAFRVEGFQPFLWWLRVESICPWDCNYVWFHMAQNPTKCSWQLHNIIDGVQTSTITWANVFQFFCARLCIVCGCVSQLDRIVLSTLSSMCLVVSFLWFVLCLCVYFCDLYWAFSLLFVFQ